MGPPSQEFLVEALCLFVHRAQAEHLDTVAQMLRGVVQGLSPLSSPTLQQVFTTAVFLANFEAFKDLQGERLVARRESNVMGPAPDRPFPPPPPNAAPPHATSAASNFRDTPVLGLGCEAFATLRSLSEVVLRRLESEGGGGPAGGGGWGRGRGQGARRGPWR
jgi:hypothetical protein